MIDIQKENSTLLHVKGLKKFFPIQAGIFRKVVGHIKAVNDVSFSIKKGETLGLVGESGCGKTTTGRCILKGYDLTAGEIWFNDQEMDWVNVAELTGDRMKIFRRHAQYIFQDPVGSLDPRMSILDIVGEGLSIHGVSREKRTNRVAELLELVGLRPEYMSRYPHAFSGGQRQRIGIARALALSPQFIVCDEPVSALDVSVQAQVLNLLQRLQEKLGLTYLFIAHQLNVVEHICDRVVVMYVGQLVEVAETEVLYGAPLHPYTEALMSAVPRPDPRSQIEEIILPGEVANPADPPSGCYFHPRCSYAIEACSNVEPQLEELEPDHFVKCLRAHALNLRGVEAYEALSGAKVG